MKEESGEGKGKIERSDPPGEERRKYLKTVGALVAGLAIGGAAGWFSKPAERVEAPGVTVTERVTETVTPTPITPRFHELTQLDLREVLQEKVYSVFQPYSVPEGMEEEVKVEDWGVLPEFTEEEKAKIADMDLHFQYFDCTPDPAGILAAAGMREFGERMGAHYEGRILSIDLPTQEKQLETYEIQVGTGEMDFIGVEPANYKAQTDRFRDIGEKGGKFVFIGAAPHKMLITEPGHISLVGPGLCEQGVVSARLLVKILGGKGKIGLLSYAVPYYCSEERVRGAMSVFEQYPEIEIVAHEKFEDPARSGEIVTGMLTSHPEIEGLWTVWTIPPGYDAAVAAMELGLYGDELAITSIDLGGLAGTKAIADKENPLKAVCAGAYFEVGEAMTAAALKHYLGEFHPRVIAPGPAVARCNVVEMYRRICHPDTLPDFDPIPDEIFELLED